MQNAIANGQVISTSVSSSSDYQQLSAVSTVATREAGASDSPRSCVHERLPLPLPSVVATAETTPNC